MFFSCRPRPRRLFAPLALLLGSCLSLPQPFAPEVKPSGNALLALENSAGITVFPVSGLPLTASRDLARAVATALQEANIPAGLGESGNRNSLFLQGRAKTAPENGDPAAVLLEWELVDGGGRTLGIHRQTLAEVGSDWAGADPRLLERIATPAAAELARLLRDGALAERPERSPPPLYLWSIDEAPGDGEQSLKRALEVALARASVRLAKTMAESAYVLFASVRTEAEEGAFDRVALTWTLLGPDGSEIGKVEQNNRVPDGRLDGPWGVVAEAVAAGAAEGILQLLSAIAPAPSPPASPL